MSFRTRAALVAALSAFCTAPVLAQTDPSPAPSAPPEIGRVSTSDRHDEPLRDAVRTTFVVSKAEMLRRGDATVADALAHVPGLSVQRNGPLGTQADLTLDGYRTRQILLLIDGRPAGGAEIEFNDVGTLPTTGVQRIEVVEGGGATLYGAGALGGVINVITDGAGGDLRRRPRLALDTGSLGEHGIAFENGAFSFERRVARNAYAYPAVGPVAPGTTNDADYGTTSARYATAGRLGALRAGLDAGLAQNHLGAPGDAAFPPLALTARENTTAGDARLRLALDRARSSVTLELSGTARTALYAFDPADPAAAAGNLFGGTTQVSREGRLQASLRDVVQNDRGTLVAGLDLARGVGRVDDGLSPATLAFAQTALYAQQTFAAPGGARTYVGLRAERDGGFGGTLAPSLGTRLPLGAGLALRANYATGFRAPDIDELAYPVFSNPALRPERSRGGDLALDAPGLLGGASLRWFVQNGTDLITPSAAYDFTQPTSPANPYLVNVARYAIAGFVGNVRTRAYRGFTGSLALTDTYRALDLTAGSARLPRRPVLASDLALEYAGRAAGLLESAGILAHSVGPHDTPDTEFTRVDAYLRLRASRAALLSLRVFNLSNERYADVSGYPLPGRTLQLELSTR